MYDLKKVRKNAFRVTKTPGETAIRIRVPGGHLKAKHLSVIQHIAEKFGNGTVHLTIRQGYEIPGIRMPDMPRVNKAVATMIAEIEQESGLALKDKDTGYPAAGARNISACIGSRVCPFANLDTTTLAQKIEKAVYPNDFHVKIAVTGCPNDCIKAHMNDIGIIGNVMPAFRRDRCIACEACVDVCRARVTNCLYMEDHARAMDEPYCIRCGECILKCPVAALTRGQTSYRIIVGGRTGKRNPRLADTFISGADEETVLSVCRNLYTFIGNHINRSLDKEHVGYIIDRVGYETFTKEVLQGITLDPQAKVFTPVNPGYHNPIRP
jgi:anaerobic sulfite reductase subunit C